MLVHWYARMFPLSIGLKKFRMAWLYIRPPALRKGDTWLLSDHNMHSMAGVSRSVTIAVAYIVTVTGLDWDIALTAITSRCPSACPNDGFRRQLIAYQEENAAVCAHFLHRFQDGNASQ